MSEWKKCPLGDICERMVTGGTPYSKTSKYYKDGNIPWLKTKEVNFNRITSTEHFITKSGLENSSAKIIPANSVIVAMYGQGDTAGRVAINKIPLSTNQACCNLILNKTKADFLFVYYYLSKSYNELVLRKTGSAQPNLNTKLLKDFELILPPLPEQKAIAAVLSSLDDKIDLLHRQNKTLEALAETLFRQWFVEEDSNPITITEFVEFNPQRFLTKNSIAPYLEMANVNTDVFHPEHWYNREFRSGTKYKNDDTLLARITPCLENGKSTFVTFLNEEQVGWGSTEFIVMHSKQIIHPFFCYVLTKNEDFRGYAEGCLEGSSGRQRVNIDHLKSYTINSPSRNKIDRFNKMTKSILPKLIANFHQIRTLEKLRDTLLPKLMSGEVRV